MILDRMSHEVPYYAVYLKMAALQGCYCINNTFWRSADDKFFGYAAAEKLGIAEPKTVVLPNREYLDDVTAESLRNLWPTTSRCTPTTWALPCIMKPAFGGGWKDVHKIDTLDELLHLYDGSGRADDDAAGVHHLGHLHPRADDRPALRARDPLRPGARAAWAATTRTTTSCRARCATRPRSCRCASTMALGYDMNALEFAVKDGLFYGIDLTNYTPDLDYRSLKDAHFPWAVEKMAGFAIEKALSKERTPEAPDWKSLLLS